MAVVGGGERLLLFGGNDGARPLSQLFLCSLKDWVWGRVDIHISGERGDC